MNKNNLYDHNVYQKQEYKVRINYKTFSPKIIHQSRAVGTVRGILKGPIFGQETVDGQSTVKLLSKSY